MMHQDSLEPAAIRFTLKRLQESARRSGYFLPAFHVGEHKQQSMKEQTIAVQMQSLTTCLGILHLPPETKTHLSCQVNL